MSRLIDPRNIIAIRNLQLAARTTVEGFLAGINKSRVKGPGLEFSQYRSYQPGDDLRWLDWKMYGRSDRYYIRESEIETSITIRFLVDASASMDHEDNGYSKLDYVRYLAATLAFLAGLQGDSVGLYALQQNQVFALPARRDHQHLSRIYFQLEQLKTSGRFTDPLVYKNIFSGGGRRELLVFFTDLYQDHSEIMSMLDSLAPMKHEILVFHIMGGNELAFDFGSRTTLEDLETGQTVQADSAQAETYRTKMQSHIESLRMQLLDRNIFYRMMNMRRPVDQALRDFLNQRNKLKA